MAFTGLTETPLTVTAISEEINLRQELDSWAIPDDPSSGAMVLGHNGAMREIVLDFIIVETSLANLQTAISKLEEYVNGRPGASITPPIGVTYSSDLFSASLSVTLESISYRYSVEETGTFAVRGTLRMIEGDDS